MLGEPGKPSYMQLRMTLALIVAVAMNLLWIVEQPSQSLLEHHHRFSWFIKKVVWEAWSKKSG